jgi:hypothetical protein
MKKEIISQKFESQEMKMERVKISSRQSLPTP